ncbi:DUF58 domain-containing protein [Aliiglaciecola litoralis]|uniref:DUF58 domain-containing protein n=1 Tax=Aliiglaciecola litoralis TaxID=582857 RepID=A0ABN1LNF3_9ALTE
MKIWQRRLSTWLDKRIPAARHFTLGYKNIFIFPSRFGGLYLILCIGLFLLGSNYQNNLMTILCYFLISLFLLNLFVAYLNFAKLDIQLGKVQNCFAKDTIQLPIWINHTKEPAHGLISLHFWQHKDSVTADLDDYSNPIYLALLCEKRGPLTLSRVTFSSTYPLGLFRCWTHLQFSSDILIYPTPLICSVTLQSQLNDDNQPNTSQHVQRGHDDFDSLAPYKQGEPLHHVAWKQVAKGQGMISKQFSNQSGSSGWLTLASVPANDIEIKLSQLCYQVIELTRTNQAFGLDLGSQKIALDSGIEHQHRCLSALAQYRAPMQSSN